MGRKVVCLTVVAFLLTLAMTSCGGDGSVTLTFNQTSSDCATASQSAGAIQCNDGVLTFEGSVLTPNPCYYLTANLDVMNKSDIVIVISAMPALLGQDAYCVECVGQMAFSGEVSPVGSCSRSVSIVYNGDTIAEYED